MYSPNDLNFIPGLPYAALAIATDYDCWKEETVDVQKVMETLKTASGGACRILRAVLPKIAAHDWKSIQNDLDEVLKVAVMHTDS